MLRPTRFFTRITSIDIDRDLVAAGIDHVFVDVDNTVLTRDTHEVPADVRAWLSRVREAGVALCFVSNNWHANVLEVAGELGFPIVHKAVKPLPFAFVRAAHILGTGAWRGRRSACVIGDQLITDGFGARLLGMRCYLLEPLVQADLTHTLMLRPLERAILGGMKPEDA